MDIGRALSFVFDDHEWIKKILIGGLISLIPLIGGFIVYGYMIEIVQRVYGQATIDELPEWDDVGSYLTRGFIFWLGLALWALPFILLITGSILMVILLGVASGEDAIIGVSIGLFYLIFFPAIMLFSLGSALVIPLLLGRYAVQGRFGAMFEFPEIIVEVRQIGAVPLLLLVVTYFVATSVGQVGVFLCFVGVIFTAFYGNLVIAHAAGQTYRLAGGSQPADVEVRQPVGY